MNSAFLQPGRNCWQVPTANHLSFLIDGETCFRAVREGIIKARASICILSWDIHSQVRLLRGEPPDDGYPVALGPLLEAVLKERPNLHVYILNWDYSMVYANEREWRTLSETFGKPHQRLRFQADDALPFGASHHQKVVVIDGRVAFVGGMDLSSWRWDSSSHALKDSRRIDPSGKPYQPYHDSQTLVSGAAAATLRELFEARWRHAGGEALPQLEPDGDGIPWPESVAPDFETVPVAIARTRARHDLLPPIGEILQLHLDAIAAARDFIFLENQYLSSAEIAEALTARLRETNGPEVILLLTHNAEGWLEQNTMGIVRDRLLERLSSADTHGRFHVYYPEAVEGNKRRPIYLHSKLFIVDDRMVKVGSANLSNRSMKVDSECDLLLVFDQAEEKIRFFRHRLIGTYFQKSPEEVAAVCARAKSLSDGIKHLATADRNGLRPLTFGCTNDLQRQLADSRVLDPDEPLDPGYWLQRTVPAHARRAVLSRFTLTLLGLTAAIVAGVMVSTGDLSFFEEDSLRRYLSGIRDNVWSPIIVLLLFFVSGLIGVSINLLLIVSVLVLGPIQAFLAGVAGAQCSALAGFLIGRRLGRPLAARLSNKNVNAISRWIGRLGIPGLALARLVPVAPFVVVNVVAGSSHLSGKTFHWGTLLGLLPGMLIVVLLTDRTSAAVQEPNWTTGLTLAAVGGLAFGAFLFVKRKLSAPAPNK